MAIKEQMYASLTCNDCGKHESFPYYGIFTHREVKRSKTEWNEEREQMERVDIDHPWHALMSVDRGILDLNRMKVEEFVESNGWHMGKVDNVQYCQTCWEKRKQEMFQQASEFEAPDLTEHVEHSIDDSDPQMKQALETERMIEEMETATA